VAERAEKVAILTGEQELEERRGAGMREMEGPRFLGMRNVDGGAAGGGEGKGRIPGVAAMDMKWQA
jgi:hypothetical protein